MMKRLVLSLSIVLFHIMAFAQSHNDYMDDDAVAGGADRALNSFIILFLIVIAFVVIVFIFGGIATNICTWSGHISPSIISTPFHLHSVLSISRIPSLFSPKNTFLLYFGANTI